MSEAVSEAVTIDRIKPMPTRILVRHVERAEKTRGGIYLPDTTRDISQLGEVVEVGEQVSVVKPGDVVVFQIYAARPCIADLDEHLLFIRELDILAVVEEQDP